MRIFRYTGNFPDKSSSMANEEQNILQVRRVAVVRLFVSCDCCPFTCDT